MIKIYNLKKIKYINETTRNNKKVLISDWPNDFLNLACNNLIIFQLPAELSKEKIPAPLSAPIALPELHNGVVARVSSLYFICIFMCIFYIFFNHLWIKLVKQRKLFL